MNIRHLCYELYKLDWKRSHMITAEREMDSVKDYYECLGNYEMEDESEYTYDDYLEEFGYDGGELYVCYEEFCDAEYQNKKYMQSLLSNANLVAIYLADVEERKNNHRF